jgi:hypothetical protein
LLRATKPQEIKAGDQSSSPDLLPTEQAALLLGLKRQQFLTLKKFFGLEPKGRNRLRGKTSSNLFDTADLKRLIEFGNRCRTQGWRNFL